MGKGIVVIGATFVDIKGYPFGRYIPFGRNAGRIIEVHGGVCRNIAEDIANVGLHPTFVSLVDEGAASTAVLERLNERRCDTSHIRCTADGLGTWLAVFDHAGDLVASISKRPNLAEIKGILDEEGDEIFEGADSVVVEADVDTPLFEMVLSLAKRHDKRVFAPVSNMSIASERRELLRSVSCLVCNQQEAGILFSEDYEDFSPEELCCALKERIDAAGIASMVVTMGERGSVFAEAGGEVGICPALKADVVDTTGAGDAYFSGVAIGLTYGKTLPEACSIGTRLASAVVANEGNVCPRFMPAEFGIEV